MTIAAPAISRRSAPIRPMMLDDQVKLNDPGASQYLIETLAQDGWNGLLRYLRGRSVAAAQPRRRRCPRGAKLCRRGALSRCAGRRLALARHYADESRAAAAEAKPAFARYLAMKPDAPDAAWVRQMVG